jgi:hypothetical protein
VKQIIIKGYLSGGVLLADIICTQGSGSGVPSNESDADFLDRVKRTANQMYHDYPQDP